MARILVADDDSVMLGLLTTLLSFEGDEAITVRRVDEVLPTARREEPDLIFMDVHLGQGNTFDILQELRTHPQTQSIPVLMTSGLDLRDKALKMGANGFIMKPFRPNLLLERIHTMIVKPENVNS
ncbi:MAG: PleD family two-component system response regulator [Anaerolineales bacterium]